MLSFSMSHQAGRRAGTVFILALCGLLRASEQGGKPGEKGLPPMDADFAVQGEYEGLLSGGEGSRGKFGVQVIARGKGSFLAVGHRGGLPGAGWDRSPRIQAEGRTRRGVAEFPGFLGGATIREGVLAIRGDGGKTVGELKRVIRTSPTLGAKPPENAKVLFDGTVNDFRPGAMTADKLLMVPQDSRHIFTRDFRLHLEFRTPYKPHGRGQGRGNSGVYLLGRYEIQVLDTFGLEGKRDECGAFYGRRAPDVNMCLPPGSWQTYDVEFKMARFDDGGQPLTPPTVTVRHNGFVIHEKVELEARRKDRIPPKSGPLHLQAHDTFPVHYRNIWVVEG